MVSKRGFPCFLILGAGVRIALVRPRAPPTFNPGSWVFSTHPQIFLHYVGGATKGVKVQDVGWGTKCKRKGWGPQKALSPRLPLQS